MTQLKIKPEHIVILSPTQSSSKNTLLLVGRDDWQKDKYLNQILLDRLRQSGVKLVWEEPAAHAIYALRAVERRLGWLPKHLKKINLSLIQLLYGITHPSYFYYLYQRKNKSIASRCESLKRTIQKTASHHPPIILARSAGGRISSLIADELGVKHIICLGYPFKHPEMPDEPERYAHLKTLKTPMLIIQGIHDKYGGADISEQYPLSTAIEVFYVDTNHEFTINDHELSRVVEKIEGIINRCTNAPQAR